jgi:ribose/xylose/arabinose/galactoside ABC-type transport system permease subunit/ABC-type multidrug transport system ATPase subunit
MVGRQTAGTVRTQDRPLGKVALETKNLSAGDGSFRDVSMSVRRGEILGLYGLVGAGRTAFGQALVGMKTCARGEIRKDGLVFQSKGIGAAARQGIAYVPEDRLRLGVCAGLSVKDNALLASVRRLARGPFVLKNEERQRTQLLVRKLGVRCKSVDQEMATLSGGNQQKVVLGRWLECEPEILVLDEPTRGIDVGAKEEIHALLGELTGQGKAIILISSDLPEILGQSDSVGVFREGRLVHLGPAGDATSEQLARAALPVEAVSDFGASVVRASSPAVRLTASLREAGLVAAVAVIAVFLAFHTDTFWQEATLRDIAQSAALLVLSGLGAGLVILAGAIDISFGSIMALSAAVAGDLMRRGWAPASAICASLAVGVAAAALNASLSLVSRVRPIVITLGTGSFYRGLTLLLIGARAIHEVPEGMRQFFLAAPFGFPMAMILALAAMSLAWLVLGWTVPGRRVLALGSNPQAARRAGISKARSWIAVFALEGFCAACAGVLALAMAGHLQATDFDDMTLDAIGVAVVGGIAITGGRGSVWGILAASLLFCILEKGWLLLHISSFWQRSIVGTMLLAAILFDRFWQGRAHFED